MAIFIFGSLNVKQFPFSLFTNEQEELIQASSSSCEEVNNYCYILRDRIWVSYTRKVNELELSAVQS
jgi:hypothetical protein